MFEVYIATVTDLKNFKIRWNNLVHSMEKPSIFCTWEWIHTWWEHFGHRYKEFILKIYDNDKLVGILPLGLRHMFPEDSLVPVRVLSFCGTHELHSDYTDLIYAGADPRGCLSAILGFLATNFRDWDVLHFSHVSDDSHLMRFFTSNGCRFQSETRPVSTAPYIPLRSKFENNFEKYLQSMSGKRRHELRRQRRVLHDKYGISYIHSNARQHGMGIRRLFELHAMRASSKRITSTFQGEKLLRFHERISEIFEREGTLCLRYLSDGDSAIAGLYCFLFAGRLLAYQSGFDPTWELKRVGAILFFDVIHEAADRGIIEFDFLRGGESYKGTWTNEARTLYDIWVYNNTARSGLFRLACRARNIAKTLILRLLS